jgi:hypothetical protein
VLTIHIVRKIPDGLRSAMDDDILAPSRAQGPFRLSFIRVVKQQDDVPGLDRATIRAERRTVLEWLPAINGSGMLVWWAKRDCDILHSARDGATGWIEARLRNNGRS